MRRGTTPTLTFTLPFDADNITALSVAFAQSGQIILEKELADCQVAGKTVTVALTEADTLEFSNNRQLIEIQLRVGIGSKRLASEIIQTSVNRILRDGFLLDGDEQ